MLNVTEKAQEQIALYFNENEIKPIRVFLNSSCCGSQAALAFDDAKPDDKIFEFAGIRYLVDNAFLAIAKPIEIDYVGNGYKITSALEAGGGCGGCGSSNTCCS